MWTGEENLASAWLSISQVWSAIQRHLVVLMIWVTVCLATALVYLHAARPEFSATTQVVLQPRVTAVDGPENVRLVHQRRLDDQQAETQLLVIRSDRLLRQVFDALDLADTPELAADDNGILPRLIRWWHENWRRDRAQAKASRAFEQFTERVGARRLALSYVLEISYWTEDPKQAARVASAIASAYARDRIEAAVAGAPYLNSRIGAIEVQQILATGSMRAGAVPQTDFPDADVRLLGPAIAPLGGSFPRSGPLLSIAAIFALVSGLLAIAIGQDSDPKIRSTRDVLEYFSVDCLGGRAGERGGSGNSLRDEDLRRVLLAARAALVSGHGRGLPCTVGFASWGRDDVPAKFAAGLTDVMAAARLPVDLLDADQTLAAAREPAARTVEGGPALMIGASTERSSVLALPPLATSARAQTLLPWLDAVFLIIEANRTTVAEARAAMDMLRHAGTPLAGVILDRSGS